MSGLSIEKAHLSQTTVICSAASDKRIALLIKTAARVPYRRKEQLIGEPTEPIPTNIFSAVGPRLLNDPSEIQQVDRSEEASNDSTALRRDPRRLSGPVPFLRLVRCDDDSGMASRPLSSSCDPSRPSVRGERERAGSSVKGNQKKNSNIFELPDGGRRGLRRRTERGKGLLTTREGGAEVSSTCLLPSILPPLLTTPCPLSAQVTYSGVSSPLLSTLGRLASRQGLIRRPHAYIFSSPVRPSLPLLPDPRSSSTSPHHLQIRPTPTELYSRIVNQRTAGRSNLAVASSSKVSPAMAVSRKRKSLDFLVIKSSHSSVLLSAPAPPPPPPKPRQSYSTPASAVLSPVGRVVSFARTPSSAGRSRIVFP